MEQPLINITELKTENGFKIKLENFEGPFDLLLHLIDEQKVAIYDISISKITAAYLEYIQKFQPLDLEVSGEFMVMAALLIEMKSKMLLPADNPDNEELLAEAEAEKRALLEKLVEYKAFKSLTQELIQREEDNLHVHTREHINEELLNESLTPKNIQLRNITMADLLRAFNKVWQDFELRSLTHDFKHLSQQVISIRDKMHAIIEKLKTNQSVMFSELFSNISSRFEIVATFIGILELVRQQFISILQNDLFDDIELVGRKDISERQIELNDQEYNTVKGVTP